MSWSGTHCTSFLIMVNCCVFGVIGSLNSLRAMNRMMGNRGATMLSSAMRIDCVSCIVITKCV